MARSRLIAPGGTRGTVFREVARVRLDDSAVLLSNKRYRGALYLAGYAIECVLKWAVTQRTGQRYLPAELEIHKWDVLLSEAGLVKSLKTNVPLHSMYSELAELWGPGLRYRTMEPGRGEAERLCHQMKEVYSWIDEQAI